MNNGAILIANNNGHIDYVKQAVFAARRIKKYLNLPVSVITDSAEYLKNNFNPDVFDQVLEIDYSMSNNQRFYFDGSLSHKTLIFKNQSRSLCYSLSPYDKTLVIDTDYVICNNLLGQCFASSSDLMLFKDACDLTGYRDMHEFKFISDKSVPFYWATVIYFEKNEKNKCFFDLINHIEENWYHYRQVYQITNPMFRNDYAFSIAVHIMQGFISGNEIVKELPGKHYFTIDKDILWALKEDRMTFLLEKENHIGEYTALTTEGLDVHVMNKFSLERCIDE